MAERIRGHLAQLYAERRQHREHVAELRHQLVRAQQMLTLANSTIEALNQLHRAAADTALHERQEVIRLSGIVARLRVEVQAAQKSPRLRHDCDSARIGARTTCTTRHSRRLGGKRPSGGGSMTYRWGTPTMLRFLDGPAAGVNLSCTRAPLFLRAVLADGKWDALDQLDDQAEPGEVIYAYRMVEDQGAMHISYTDSQGRRCGRWEQVATYRHLGQDQPCDTTLRDNKLWGAWALAAHAKEKQRG